MIAPAHDDRASFVGRRVVRACRDKRRSECRVDMAIAKAQIESAQMRGAGQFHTLAARAPDVLEKARVDRAAAAGYELDVLVEIGTVRRGCPFQLSAPLAARAGSDGVRNDLLQRRRGDEESQARRPGGGARRGQLWRGGP